MSKCVSGQGRVGVRKKRVIGRATARMSTGAQERRNTSQQTTPAWSANLQARPVRRLSTKPCSSHRPCPSQPCAHRLLASVRGIVAQPLRIIERVRLRLHVRCAGQRVFAPLRCVQVQHGRGHAAVRGGAGVVIRLSCQGVAGWRVINGERESGRLQHTAPAASSLSAEHPMSMHGRSSPLGLVAFSRLEGQGVKWSRVGAGKRPGGPQRMSVPSVSRLKVRASCGDVEQGSEPPGGLQVERAVLQPLSAAILSSTQRPRACPTHAALSISCRSAFFRAIGDSPSMDLDPCAPERGGACV